jgi:hypothetical protein
MQAFFPTTTNLELKQPVRSQLAEKDLVLHHLNAFFDHLYFTPSLGIFHRNTTLKALEVGLQAKSAWT